MTRSPEWGDTPVMMTKVVSVPVCPRSCGNAGVIFERVASVFIFMFCIMPSRQYSLFLHYQLISGDYLNAYFCQKKSMFDAVTLG